jgi:hypothetical protein
MALCLPLAVSPWPPTWAPPLIFHSRSGPTISLLRQKLGAAGPATASAHPYCSSLGPHDQGPSASYLQPKAPNTPTSSPTFLLPNSLIHAELLPVQGFTVCLSLLRTLSLSTMGTSSSSLKTQLHGHLLNKSSRALMQELTFIPGWAIPNGFLLWGFLCTIYSCLKLPWVFGPMIPPQKLGILSSDIHCTPPPRMIPALGGHSTNTTGGLIHPSDITKRWCSCL